MTPAERIAWVRSAVAALHAGRPWDALGPAAAVLAACPTDADARVLVRAVGQRAEDTATIDAAVDALVRAGDVRAAAEVRAAVIGRLPQVPATWSALASLQEQAGDPAGAERTLRQALAHVPDPTGLRCQLALVLARQDRSDEADEEVGLALQAAPGHLRPIWTALRCLPLLHGSETELERARATHRARLADFEAAVSAASPLEARRALGFAQDAFPAHYACRPDDASLQRRFGGAVHRLVATAHPDLVSPLPSQGPAGPLRVGFVSSLLRRHTVLKLFGPWIRGLDPSRFEVHVWQLGPVDAETRSLVAAGARLHGAEGNGPAATGRAIRAAGLHAVVFPEVGMDGRLMLLAAMRLAPFQAVAWGHPVTTGLPTLDAFLSAEDMERADADEDYTERLVRLPGLGTPFERPAVPRSPPTREALGLPEGVPLFLCSQSLFKLLPRQDRVFRRILEAVPDGVLVHLDLLGGERYRARLERAGVPMDRVLALPRLPFSDFLAVNHHADVVLDGLDWSGGVTTLEAVACGRVPVTLEGTLMRTRHTAAILRRLGIPELIAEDEDAYVSLAVRLATDRVWRAGLETRAREGASGLYGDAGSTDALGRLLEAHRD